MDRKRRWFWMGGIAIVLVLGSFFLFSRWDSARRLRAAFPLEEQQILEKGETFILYSLHPSPMEVDPQELKTKPVFHGYPVLGQTQITAATTRMDLLSALYTDLGKGDPAACFNPRHGIRAVRGNKTVDLVICFECQQIEIYDERGKQGTTTTHSSKPVFDRILSAANVPLASP
jgi:hypothetical protein